MAGRCSTEQPPPVTKGDRRSVKLLIQQPGVHRRSRDGRVSNRYVLDDPWLIVVDSLRIVCGGG